jgi:hypothetical protein
MLYLSCSKLISIFRLANFCQFFDRKFLSVLPFTKEIINHSLLARGNDGYWGGNN